MTKRIEKKHAEARKACIQNMWWWDKKECKRSDIGSIMVHNTKVHVGGKNKESYSPYVERVLEDNFTPREMETIENLYVETQPNFLGEGVGGSNEHFDVEGQAKASIIRIPPNRQGNHKNVEGAEDSLTHENIHALRNAMHRYIKDIDRDESETVLESISRMSKNGMDNITTGYYHYVPDLKTIEERFKAIDQDRILLNVRYENKRKGNDAIRTVENKYPESNISRVQLTEGSAAENIDRYFMIGTAKRGTIRLHKRYKKGKVPPLAETKKRLKNRYGEKATIWEWKDGVKVKIVSPKNNGTNKNNSNHRKLKQGTTPKRSSYTSQLKAYKRKMKELKMF